MENNELTRNLQNQDSSMNKTPSITAEAFGEWVRNDFFKRKNKEFVLDKYNQRVFDLLTWYFTKDPRFTEAGYDLKKSILLRDRVGCGKTIMMDAFRVNPIRWYTVIPCEKFTDYYILGGLFGNENG